MPPELESGEIIYREQVKDNLVFLRCLAPRIAENALPGQFVHVRAGSGSLPILRRPYSLFDVDGDAVDLLVAIVGRGSAIIAASQVGDKVDLIGPLGNGFPPHPPETPVMMITGGVGVAPMHFLWHRWQPSEFHGKFLLGASTKTAIPLPKTSPLREIAVISTDDGTLGYHGTVVELLQEMIEKSTVTEDEGALIYACGPVPMIRALMPVLIRHNFRGLVSIEQTMGCGIGACQGCAVATAKDKPSPYLLTCLDGPVFRFEDLDLERLPEHNHES